MKTNIKQISSKEKGFGTMEHKLWLGVYRRLDNRSEGFGDDSPRAVELHNRRKQALHDALDNGPIWRVESWGLTDDTQPHEFVELAISIVTNPTFQATALPVLVYFGGKLLDAAVDKIFIDPIKELISRLYEKQKRKEILDYQIRPSGEIIIRCDPIDDDMVITLLLKDGEEVKINFNTPQQEIDQLIN